MTAAEFKDAIWSIIANLAILYCVVQIIAYAWSSLPFWKDDTDPPGGRSGLKVYTDHGTGQQYIESSRGGLTPRLDFDGKQIEALKAQIDELRSKLFKAETERGVMILEFDELKTKYDAILSRTEKGGV